PTPRERQAAPHYGIDVLEPTERASAAWWATEADRWIRDAAAHGRVPIVVGGTGLYLRALFGELFDEPPMHPARRAELQAELGALPTDELRRWVERLDRPRAHLGRTQLLRAAEIALLTGRRMSELLHERRTVPRWRARYLVVDPGPALAGRIAERTRAMFAAGWPDEGRRLRETVPPGAPAWNASGYGAVREMVQGRISFDEAEERVIIETRQYAKRQRTWFRHQLAGADVTRLDAGAAVVAGPLRRWWGETDA
ncbi:MAG TPA: tRNA dimethylallyltransferase, partial [Gemmatimonadaceae bacterium]|nr:tRNA dimethylallyltransferase [Gemmatimonadaceae bacterium]